jgi:hypothetical protein
MRLRQGSDGSPSACAEQNLPGTRWLAILAGCATTRSWPPSRASAALAPVRVSWTKRTVSAGSYGRPWQAKSPGPELVRRSLARLPSVWLWDDRKTWP